MQLTTLDVTIEKRSVAATAAAQCGSGGNCGNSGSSSNGGGGGGCHIRVEPGSQRDSADR